MDPQATLLESLRQQSQQLAELQAHLRERDKAYEELSQKVESMKVGENKRSKKSTKKSKSLAPKIDSKCKHSATKAPNTSSKATTSNETYVPSKSKNLSAKPSRSSDVPKTSKKATEPSPKTTARKTPQKNTATSPKPSPKRNVNQLIMKGTPQDFKPTKEAFFVFIRVLWGLVFSGAVPKAPDPSLLTEFNSRFSNGQQIENVIKSPVAPDLVPIQQVTSLREARVGRNKVGKGILNLKDFFIKYAQSMLAKLGMRSWAPNLDEAPDTLYNEACRISAIQIFRQVVVGGGFDYMNVNKHHIENIQLLEATYNHYVHYWIAEKYKIENKQEGKNILIEERKRVQRARQRLKKSRYQFAAYHNWPERYLKMLGTIEAHSDDEYNEKHGVYIVKTPQYRSEKANIFMRRVDEEMLIAQRLEGKRSQTRPRRRPKVPIPSSLTRPPKGLPLDFYDPDNASKSIRAKAHFHEKFSYKKFTQMNWDEASIPYNLDHEKIYESESEIKDDNGESDTDSYAGDSIDLAGENSGDEEEDSDDEYEEEDEDIDFEECDENQPSKTLHKSLQEDEDMEDADREDDDREARYNDWLVAKGTGEITGDVEGYDEWEEWQ